MPESPAVGSISAPATGIRLASVGHGFFALTMVAMGVLGLIQGDFTPMWSGVPTNLPGRELIVYLSALVALGTGVGLLWQRSAVAASRSLLVYFLCWLLIFRLSHLV